jgi:hypothetical protein
MSIFIYEAGSVRYAIIENEFDICLSAGVYSARPGDDSVAKLCTKYKLTNFSTTSLDRCRERHLGIINSIDDLYSF